MKSSNKMSKNFIQKSLSKQFTNLSLVTRVCLALFALVIAYVIINFGMVSYESFAASSGPLSESSSSGPKSSGTTSEEAVPFTIINFYSMEGCGYCVQFQPEWDTLSKLHPSGSKLKDGSILVLNHYSTADPEGLAKINEDNISGFPTITIRAKNSPIAIPYTGKRTADDLWYAVTNPV